MVSLNAIGKSCGNGTASPAVIFTLRPGNIDPDKSELVLLGEYLPSVFNNVAVSFPAIDLPSRAEA